MILRDLGPELPELLELPELPELPELFDCGHQYIIRLKIMSNFGFIAPPEAYSTELVILAIDTSSRRASLAVSCGEEVVATLTISNNRPHSQTIFSHISVLLEVAGVAITEINAFAAATGPGSFTGLRVGLSAIKGLADSLGRPGFGIDSLDLLALASGFDGAHLAMIEAGRDEVYCGLREVVAGKIVNRSIADRVGKPSFILADLMQDLNFSALIITGDGVSKHKEEVQAFGPQWLINREVALDRSAVLAKRAFHLLKSGQTSPIRPHYIRPSDAEIKCHR
jgi:tRNA threonylcarbamoyladenosine biosynthesis protein TsaB